ncbi:MAG: iron-sulfur cluster assembly scaffold protein [Acidobacteriota bacterium]|nr:iron-sulfur cluster assembly scaffold protein [Blastocatellia bacterium]MDW8412596.1 iron-sulfur cluster assembly scaffold protein [Acidobacteriota bacterium]
MTYSAKVLEHFEHPRFVGELTHPAVSVEVVNSACGDRIKLSILAEGSIIKAAAMKAVGCPPTIASASVLCEMLIAKTLSEVAKIGAVQIEAALDGLPKNKRHAAVLAAEAIQEALEKICHEVRTSS